MPNKKSDKKRNKKIKDGPLKPDPETLHTTVPQEKMKGPVSSMVQQVKKGAEGNDESKESADKKKDKNM